LWAGVVGAPLEELELTGSVMTDRETRECVRLTLSDDLRGAPDFSRGNGCVHTAAGSARTCDSDE
jgi:hypothetical protein